MKIAHYKNLFGEFKKQIVDAEIAELRAAGKYQEIADRITNEWTMLPESARGKLNELAAKAYAKAGIDVNAAEVIRLALNEGLIYAKIAADCQGAEDELARLWEFLKQDDPGTGLDTVPDPVTPFGIAQCAMEKSTGVKAIAFPSDIQDKILDVMRPGSAKQLLEKRWKNKGNEPRYPQKFAKASRRGYAPKITDADELALLRHFTGMPDPLPIRFKLLEMMDPGNTEEALRFFEPTCDFQVLLLFLIEHSTEFSASAFFNYYFYTVYYNEEEIDANALLDATYSQEGKTVEFMRLCIRAFSLHDETAEFQQKEMLDAGFPEAATALGGIRLLRGENIELTQELIRAAGSGSAPAAAQIMMSGSKTTPAITALARKCFFSETYLDVHGNPVQKPFVKCRLNESLPAIREKIGKLSPAEQQEMKQIWIRAAAINEDPEKLPGIYEILYRIEKQLGSADTAKAMYRAAIAGSMDALMDWYDALGEKGWPIYQKRLRLCALKLNKLNVKQKIHLGLVKAVEG